MAVTTSVMPLVLIAGTTWPTAYDSVLPPSASTVNTTTSAGGSVNIKAQHSTAQDPPQLCQCVVNHAEQHVPSWLVPIGAARTVKKYGILDALVLASAREGARTVTLSPAVSSVLAATGAWHDKPVSSA